MDTKIIRSLSYDCACNSQADRLASDLSGNGAGRKTKEQHMHKKLLTTKQYKLDKGLDASVLTAGITLSPAGEASLVLGR